MYSLASATDLICTPLGLQHKEKTRTLKQKKEKTGYLPYSLNKKNRKEN
jgi:hypothetical protein